MAELRWETVTPLLREGLEQFMAEPLFDAFRLVGGTSLSLQLGHRESIDIDLFTDMAYGSIDFSSIDRYLRAHFNYVFPAALPEIIGMGMPYIVGNDAQHAFKLDLFYTDTFIELPLDREGIRLASIYEIIAMKIDVVQRKGRKKDFWDLHEFIETIPVNRMLELHEQRYPYNHEPQLIRTNLTDFSLADTDFDPVALNGKYWELIKLDFVDLLRKQASE